MKRRIATVLIALAMVLTLSVPSLAAEYPINLVIDNVKVTTGEAPFVDENDTTQVPLRLIAETLGGEVSWNASKKQATIQTAGYTVVFTIDSKTFTVNGETKTLASPAKLTKNGNTVVPIRAFAQSIGADVSYDAKTHTASVKYFTKMSGSLKIGGSTTLAPIAQKAATKLMSQNSGLSVTVDLTGSGAGIKDATAGTINIGMSSREVTADEMKALNVYAVANDGIAIIVHPDNPVKNLTKEQAGKIFLGEIKNWKDVGGDNAPILVQTRETGSGTLGTLEEMLLNKKNVVSTATPYASSGLIKQAVAKEKNAIGFDSVGFVDATVKALTLDGKAATATTVINGTYGMGRQLYCVTKGRATGAAAIFIDYLRTVDCQNNIVVNEGYVKLEGK